MNKPLMAVVAAVVAAAAIPVIASANPPNSYEPPPPGTVTVPPKGPGEDYKSNLATPEQRPTPPAAPISEEQRRAIFESFDPHDSPNILVCVNDDGSGQALIVEPAGPEAEAAPETEAGPRESIPMINDKGTC